MFFIGEDIPIKFAYTDTLACEIENLINDVNLCIKKWLISGSYNSYNSYLNLIQGELARLSKTFDFVHYTTLKTI